MTAVILITSVIIGTVLGVIFRKSLAVQRILLTFSGAFLLTITVLEIFPQIFQADYPIHLGLFVLLGVFIQILLENITQGAEHGHFHQHEHSQFPLAIFIGLFLHAFIEGMPISNDDTNHLLMAIVVHKIPVALILFLFIADLTPNLKKQLSFMSLFALASPLGFWIGDGLDERWFQPILAIVAGIFLHISTVIIFESADGHKMKIRKFLALVLGFLLAYLTLHQH
ncbi:MAG: ZIP family metal transporter [Flavobacteriaceae bacterium]|nr:ZIP family metal transporter [Flavobacteriaceae bacterium]